MWSQLKISSLLLLQCLPIFFSTKKRIISSSVNITIYLTTSFWYYLPWVKLSLLWPRKFHHRTSHPPSQSLLHNRPGGTFSFQKVPQDTLPGLLDQNCISTIWQNSVFCIYTSTFTHANIPIATWVLISVLDPSIKKISEIFTSIFSPLR